MRTKALLAAAALAVVVAACDAGTATAPGSVLHPAGPVAEGGVGLFGSGGATPPPPSDSTRP
jgi:hypothetical protein